VTPEHISFGGLSIIVMWQLMPLSPTGRPIATMATYSVLSGVLQSHSQ